MLSKQAAAFAAAAIVISRNPFERREQIDKIDQELTKFEHKPQQLLRAIADLIEPANDAGRIEKR